MTGSPGGDLGIPSSHASVVLQSRAPAQSDMTSGFLGLGGTWRADLNLTLQLAMGVGLVCGMALARARRFHAHKYCQASVVGLNLALIVGLMAPAFETQVVPHLGEATTSAYFAVPVIHATLGTIAELLAIYVVLVAATPIVPAALRFDNYKLWMRATLVLWWSVIVLGIGIYAVWYRSDGVMVAAQPPSEPARVSVAVSNFAFEPQTITVTAGTTVDWNDIGGRHTVEFDDGSFKSEEMVAGGQTSRTFSTPGTYPYHCGLHGDAGSGMAGTVIVVAR
jgi:plastocyanin